MGGGRFQQWDSNGGGGRSVAAAQMHNGTDHCAAEHKTRSPRPATRVGRRICRQLRGLYAAAGGCQLALLTIVDPLKST